MARAPNEKAHFTFIWTLEDPAWHVNLFQTRSPIFSVESMEMTRWHLEMCVDRLDALCDSPTYSVELSVHREDDGPENIDVDFELSFLKVDGLHSTKMRESRQSKRGSCCFGMERSFDEIFVRSRAEFLPKNILTIRCRMWRKAAKIRKPGLCFGRTRMKMDRHFFIWAVPGISSLELGQKKTRLLKSNSNTASELTLYFGKGFFDGKEYLRLRFEPNCEAGKGNDYMVGEIALLNDEGEAVLSEQINRKVYREFDFIMNSKMVLEKQKLLSDKSVLVHENALLIKCEFDILHGAPWSCIENDQSGSSQLQAIGTAMSEETVTSSSLLWQNVYHFYGHGSMCDVTLRAGSRSFPAHKYILGSRSPVFKGMFMSGSDGMCIDVPDMDSNTLCHLLSYIYKNEMPQVEWEGAANLLKAADKFQLLDLKETCLAFLKSRTSKSNFCRVLSHANVCGGKELLATVLDFMCQNSDVFKSEAWKVFKEANPKLATETMEQVICDVTSSNSR